MVSVFSEYEALGCKTMKNGARLFGKVPHFGQRAYLHATYPPCPEEGIRKIESAVGMKLPTPLRQFLSLSNGLEVFFGTLSIFGWRENFKRTEEAVQSQPYSIITPNTVERPAWLGEKYWIVGSYNWDGSPVCVEEGSRIRVRDPDSGEILSEWKTLNDFLKSEAVRLRKFFDDDGKEIDEDANTLPGN
ncbi:hypothetical protein FHS27_001370 [Rhodopirellula rubra]|uniref:Knr4/Smi1-like domain-containing protein n=1 Tax=Aporhodopirellula rubra TaxID=980271 RepID=A0A7W5H548_9BACT|nr:SMI1/KNR4 family protein [Aporhodopirellula rubra]MBB3205570.1 hypothetical protein [Aporhodopirellula rubra]